MHYLSEIESSEMKLYSLMSSMERLLYNFIKFKFENFKPIVSISLRADI